jgi:hypothetical protein
VKEPIGGEVVRWWGSVMVGWCHGEGEGTDAVPFLSPFAMTP